MCSVAFIAGKQGNKQEKNPKPKQTLQYHQHFFDCDWVIPPAPGPAPLANFRLLGSPEELYLPSHLVWLPK